MRADFDITYSESIYRQKDTLQIAKAGVTPALTRWQRSAADLPV